MNRRPGLPRRSTWLALALVLLAGCTVSPTGHPSSTSSWQRASHRALGEVISALGTARIVIEQEQRDHVPHTYAVVTVTDAIETSGREISSYEVGQPPDELHGANAAVGDALDQASSLLVEVRVTLASPGLTAERAGRLVDQIDTLRDQLDHLDTAVMSSPRSVGSG